MSEAILNHRDGAVQVLSINDPPHAVRSRRSCMRPFRLRWLKCMQIPAQARSFWPAWARSSDRAAI
jgi:hypothetical protein